MFAQHPVLLPCYFFLRSKYGSKVRTSKVFLKKLVLKHLTQNRSTSDPSLLSVLHKPLARLGANVLGIDPVEDSIGTARLHSSYDPDLRGRVSYRACTLEELSSEGEEGDKKQGEDHFHAVVASEVVEHLADLETFAFCCSHVLKVCVCVLLQLLTYVRWFCISTLCVHFRMFECTYGGFIMFSGLCVSCVSQGLA